MASKFLPIRYQSLYKSQPSPQMFGNPANEKTEHWTSSNWLTSLFHFAFAEYYSGPSRFGVLRVLNDDLVQPKRGFGTHPHANMEIVTLVVKGFLTHKDSVGTTETIGAGAVQFMTAGRGIRHSEFNDNPTEPLRFIQMWILPRTQNLEPNYGSWSIPSQSTLTEKRWRHLVGDVQRPDPNVPIHVNQDVNIFVGYTDSAGPELEFEIKEGRQAYLLCLEGNGKINKTETVEEHDGGKFVTSGSVTIASESSVRLLLLEMEQSN